MIKVKTKKLNEEGDVEIMVKVKGETEKIASETISLLESLKRENPMAFLLVMIELNALIAIKNTNEK